MQLTEEALADYLASVAQLLERYGVVLDLAADEDLALDESPAGSLSFEIRGFLPDGHKPPVSVVELREVWRPNGDALERWEYEFELLDHERDFRRAFHLHDRDAFVRRFQVVVHEHCDRPIGKAPCRHFEGHPVRDAFGGAELLVSAWVDSVVADWDRVRCLQPGDRESIPSSARSEAGARREISRHRPNLTSGGRRLGRHGSTRPTGSFVTP